MAVNVNKLRDKLKQNEEKKNSKGGSDPRFLNYYDLNIGEEMTVRLMPDNDMDDQVFVEYEQHGPNFKNENVSSIRCIYESDGKKCPACRKRHDAWKAEDKETSQKWRSKQYYLAQCIVINSPVEITKSPDGNMVKLFSMPFHIKEMLVDNIMNGSIEDPTQIDLVIKKTKQGTYNRYDKSYFRFGKALEDVPDEVLSSLESGETYLYSLNEQLPATATVEELEEWVANAEKYVDDQPSSGGYARRAEAEEDGDAPTPEPSSTKTEEEPAGTVVTSAKLDALIKRKKTA